MTNDRELVAFFHRARATVRNDPAHHLPLGWRQAIWAKIGPRALAGAAPTLAHVKRAELAAASTEQALPVWRSHFDHDELPMRALKTSGAVLKGEITAKIATAVSDETWQAMIDLSAEANHPAISAGFAAAQALNVAIHDEFFDPANIDLDRTDDDDPETIDAAYFSAIAISEGFPYDALSKPGRRRDFWLWWLNHAFRSAEG